MARIRLCDGRRALYQWDTGVQVELCGCEVVTECHFPSASGGLILRDVVDGVCDVPDASLQQAGVLTVYAFSRSPMGGLTRHEFRLYVEPRPKPADYINPPDEKEFIDLLYERLKDEIVGPAGPQGEPGAAGKDGVGIASWETTQQGETDDDWSVYDITLTDGSKRRIMVKNGRRGSQGPQGERGETGPAGPQGERGIQGVQGERGETGPQGERGSQGERGPAGPQGDPGPQGEAGPAGKTGVGISSLAQTTTSTADDGVNVWTATLTDGTKKTFSVRNGSKGPAGPQGERGDPGEAGPAGPQGERGDPGEAGPAGPQGVQGERGIQGERGEAGPAGDPGKDGTSVTVQSVTESTEDGGTNVVTFSDGKQLRVRNGSKGSPGEGGSGGSTSKYAQPDWGVDANGEILPEMTGEVNPDMGGVIVASPLNAPIVSGNLYTVGFNGTEYQCTAVYLEEQNGYVIGNGAAMGMETPDTDAPFVLLVLPPETAAQTGMYAACIPLDGSASCTFYVTGEMIHKIPDDYIEGGGVYYFGVDDTGTTTATFDEIHAALKKGKQVCANYGMNIIPVSAWSNEYISLFGVTGHSSSHLQAYSLSLSARGENSFKFVSIATV